MAQCFFGINYIQIDNTNINSLASEIQTPAFGYEKKLIVIKNSELFKKTKTGSKKKTTKISDTLEEKIINYIEENIEEINKSLVIVFIEDEIDSNTLSKVIETHGAVCNFEKLKLLDLKKRLKQICNAYKVNINDNTMEYFIQNCGTSMQVLINEIRKLIEYAGENGTITKEGIDLLSTKELEVVIFDLTDSLGKKNLRNALDILNELLYNKEPIQKILVTLYNHFKKLYITSMAIEENRNLTESLNLKANQMFLANKYKMQVSYFNKTILRKILQELIDLDYNYKQGNIDINIGLEAILCTYCG